MRLLISPLAALCYLLNQNHISSVGASSFSLRQSTTSETPVVAVARELDADTAGHEDDSSSSTEPLVLTAHNIKQNRIRGGHDTDEGEYPSFVQWGVGCGGNLIYEDIVLSAAHCLDGYTGGNEGKVIVGSHRFQGGSRHKAIEFVPHPNFSPIRMYYDIIILKLETPAVEKPAIVNSDRNIPAREDVLTVLGFGKTGETIRSGGASTLQEVEIDYIPYEVCNQLYNGINDDYNICAGGDGKGACWGDSGGPLLAPDGSQVGVVSWGGGVGCGYQHEPIVYSRVSTAYRWIENQICMYSSNPPTACTPVTIRFINSANANTRPQSIKWRVKDEINLRTIHDPISSMDVEPNTPLEFSIVLMPGEYGLAMSMLDDVYMLNGISRIWIDTEMIQETDFSGFTDFFTFTVPTHIVENSIIRSDTLNQTIINQTALTPLVVEVLLDEPATPPPTPSPTPKPTGAFTTYEVSDPNSTTVDIVVVLSMDGYPDEIGWEILDKADDRLLRVVNERDYPWNLYRYRIVEETITLPRHTEYRFTITDSYGDGLRGAAYYAIWLEGTQVFHSDTFQYTEFVEFGIA